MKQLTIFSLTFTMLCCFSNIAFAQNFSESDNNGLVKELVKLKFPLAELEWEKPVSRKSVFFLNGGIGGAFSAGANSTDGNYFRYLLAPYATTGFRNYYNISKCYQQGKNIQNNAANFFCC